jgi:hypothetical protein
MKIIKEYSLKNCFLSVAIFFMLALGFTKNIDSAANHQLESSFQSAMTTFVLVRGLNAAISVFQGTEVAIEPGGVGVVLTPGQILDPANDLIERFSWVVLAAGTSLGAQIILLKFGSSLLAKVLLSLAGGTLLICMWSSVLDNTALRSVLIKLSLLILFLRFLVPVVVLANEAIYMAFLEPTHLESFQGLEKVAEDADDFQSQENSSLASESEQGLLSSIGRFYERTTQGMNIASRYREFSDRIETSSKDIVNMIAVYTFQTFVFPLLFLMLAIRLGRTIIAAKFWIQSVPSDNIKKNMQTHL